MKFKQCIDPRIRQKVEALDEDKRVEFEERAAILEYDGGNPRLIAEQLAWNELAAILRRRD
jgi:hypothetical protein